MVDENRRGWWQRENIRERGAKLWFLVQVQLAPCFCKVSFHWNTATHICLLMTVVELTSYTTETVLPAKPNIYHLDICSSFGNILDQISVAQNAEQWLFYES